MGVPHFATLYEGGAGCTKADCCAIGIGVGVGTYLLAGASLAWKVADQVFHSCMSEMSNATYAHHKHHCISRSHNTFGMTIGLTYGVGCLVLMLTTGAACYFAQRRVNKDGYDRI